MLGGHRGSNKVDRLIGSRLRRERFLAGRSREALAEALGIDTDALLDYELGRKRLAPRLLVAAVRALDLPLSLLFWEDGQEIPVLGEDDPEELSRLAISRPISLLNRDAFAPVRPLIELWQANRGRMPEDIGRAVSRFGLLHRMILTRQQPGTSRIVFAYLGAGLECVSPEESALLIDRDVHDQYDRDFGAWIERSYAENLAADDLRLDAARARVRVSPAATLDGCYHRLLLPWRGLGGERFAMGISLVQTHWWLSNAS